MQEVGDTGAVEDKICATAVSAGSVIEVTSLKVKKEDLMLCIEEAPGTLKGMGVQGPR